MADYPYASSYYGDQYDNYGPSYYFAGDNAAPYSYGDYYGAYGYGGYGGGYGGYGGYSGAPSIPSHRMIR
ncbi:MAG: hypothetical protein ACYDBV_07775 [Nitrospiria bacterium]